MAGTAKRNWLLAAVLALAGLTGCDRPCKTLADRLCEQAGGDEACEKWRDRVARVPKETCVAGLKALDRERLR